MGTDGREGLRGGTAASTALTVILAVSVTGVARAQTPSPGGREEGTTVVALEAEGSAVRAVLTNRSAVARLLRRGYRSLDLQRTLGEGRVLLRLRVEPDGSVSEARVRPGPRHPYLNGLARRVAREMTFELRTAEGAPLPASESGSAYWIWQPVDFGR